MMRFLLSETPTTSHRIEIGTDGIKLIQQSKFELTNEATSMLEWFLQAVKSDSSVRHTYTDGLWNLEYAPSSEREAFCISHRVGGSKWQCDMATMFKLLDALEGNTEGLEEEENG